MRRVVYSVAMSLDGYIAGPNGEFDWIPMDPTVDWGAFMGRFDTVLMGRKTFELSIGEGAPGTPRMRTFVFSRTLQQRQYPKVTLVSEGTATVVEGLRRAEGKEIWLMGGGVLFQSLLEAGQVDGVEVAVVPILLGGGLPMLPALSHQVRLALTGTHTYPSGIVRLSYDVQRGSS